MAAAMVEVIEVGPRDGLQNERHTLPVATRVELITRLVDLGARRLEAVLVRHGLDETAQQAAQQIRFRPARRDGQPYDSAALVHITFELAN